VHERKRPTDGEESPDALDVRNFVVSGQGLGLATVEVLGINGIDYFHCVWRLAAGTVEREAKILYAVANKSNQFNE
jgi:hypothetical protein